MRADSDVSQSKVADEAERGARDGLQVVVADGEGLQSGALYEWRWTRRGTCDRQGGALRETLVPDLDALEREAAYGGGGRGKVP